MSEDSQKRNILEQLSDVLVGKTIEKFYSENMFGSEYIVVIFGDESELRIEVDKILGFAFDKQPDAASAEARTI